ncbi:MAG: M15 family metallopeptidase [Propionibacteriaceae bacterium]|nr:M15 family metallopeptidase [Propionibacteriaceae bacterium]
MSRRNTTVVLATLLALTGCSGLQPTVKPSVAPPTASVAPSSPKPTPTPTVTPTPTPTTPKPTPTEPPADGRKGRELDRPYMVDGVPVVSKKHRITAAYTPKRPTGANGLTADTAAALKKLSSAARKAGVRIVVRSGYRSYSTQAAIFKAQLASYPSEALARRYNAMPGRSEHQTGLAVDLWDGVTWGLGVRNTATGKWLWRHSREYGFILRYPPGKEKITGYAYEPWHFRYVGTEHSMKFKPNSTKTLEEYLGID